MRIGQTLLLAVAGLLCTGCLAAVAGGGTAGLREITDKAVTYRGNIEAVYNAVRRTLEKDLGGTVKETVREEGKAGKRTIRGRTFDDEVVTIDMEPTSPSSVLVEVRVGRIGSKSRAAEIHAALQKTLKPINTP